MKPNFLVPVGSFYLVMSALVWASPVKAQGICYMVKPSGQVVNLVEICGVSSQPNELQPQSDLPVESISEEAIESEAPPRRRSRVIVVEQEAADNTSDDATTGEDTGSDPSTTESSPTETETSPAESSGPTVPDVREEILDSLDGQDATE
ncbi:MAG: hypothetical protein AAFR26_09565 [Cyanobacteria bacterium J06626_4]